MKNLNSPLRYPGGKKRAVSYLFSVQNLPNREIKEYRELFLGGGSCALDFTKKYPNIPVWVNDKYYNLFCFWKVLQERGDELSDVLNSEKDRLSSYEDVEKAHLDMYPVVKEGLRDSSTNEFDRAWMFYMINRCSFSGLGETTGSFSKRSCHDNFNHRLINRLPKISYLIRNWKITNLDYSDLIGNDPDTFIFADPPYDIESFIYGDQGNMHDSFDHKEFHDKIDDTKSMVMITYNSNERLREAYKGWNQIEWDLHYSMSNHSEKYREEQKDRKELLLLNYDIKEEITLDSFYE